MDTQRERWNVIGETWLESNTTNRTKKKKNFRSYKFDDGRLNKYAKFPISYLRKKNQLECIRHKIVRLQFELVLQLKLALQFQKQKHEKTKNSLFFLLAAISKK